MDDIPQDVSRDSPQEAPQDGHKKMSDRCKVILDKTWNQICKGNYTLDLKIKYGNILAEVGDPVVVFKTNVQEYLISMGEGKLGYHEQIVLKETGLFVDENGTNIERARGLSCVAYYLRFTNDVLLECMGKPQPRADFSVLNYPKYNVMRTKELTRDAGSASSSFITNSPIWPLIIMGLFLMYFMYRWRRY